MQRPKTRIISIRLSDDEYQGFKSFCDKHGAQSVSDAARVAIATMLGETISDAEGPIAMRLRELLGRFNQLERKVEEMATQLNAVAAVARR